MVKKSLYVLGIAIVFVGAGWGVYWLASKPTENSGTQATVSKVKVFNVDEVVNHPEKFAGFIGVEGTVTKVNEASAALTLSCEDECIMMPVKFEGRAPKEGTNVTAYGEVKKTEQAKYIFVAQEIEAK